MCKRHSIFNFLLREWLFAAAVVGLVVTSLYLQTLPSFSLEEFEVIFVLAVLFITVKGLENSGVMRYISRFLEQGGFVPLKLVVFTFILSAVVTNDIALVVIVPLTLLLNTNRKDILVILEALAANAGSAISPFGNPQNLFIYWIYDVQPGMFIKSIAPFSVIFFCIFVLVSCFIKTTNHRISSPEPIQIHKDAVFYGLFLFVVILTVLHILSLWAGILVVLYAVIFDRKSMRIDYLLLVTCICFFGLAENMKIIFSSEIAHSKHIFILSALVSQVTSNIPATLLFAKFTTQWKALLWGVNVGGFGSLVGSLANLIAYRLYVTHKSTNRQGAFTIQFILLGYTAFLIGFGLFFYIE